MIKLITCLPLLIVCYFTSSVSYAQSNNNWPVSCLQKNKSETCKMSQTLTGQLTVNGKKTKDGRLMSLTI